MEKDELLNSLKTKQNEWAKKTTARVGYDIYGSIIELVKDLDEPDQGNSVMIKATEQLIDKENKRAVAFNDFEKNEPTESVSDWQKGYLYGLKEGMLRQARESVELIQSIN